MRCRMVAVILDHDLIAFPTVALGAFLEGEATIVTATVFSTLGSFHTWAVTLGAIVGTLLGDQLIYWIGRIVGSPERAVVFGKQIVSPAAVERARHYFHRHGGKTVFLLRYAYGMRTAGYFLAGAIRMHYIRFLVADLLGTISWVFALVFLGLLVGKPAITFIEGWGGLAVGIACGLVLAVLAIRFQRRFRPDAASSS